MLKFILAPVILIVACLALFVFYLQKIHMLVSPDSIEQIGQFGDAFGFCTSIFTLLALIGLIWQLWIMRKQHEESLQLEKSLHKESLEEQRKASDKELKAEQQRHEADKADIESRHQALMELQKNQHQALINLQIAHHKEDLELQRMTLTASEHPIIQTASLALKHYRLEGGTNTSVYLFAWCFNHVRQPLARNPVFGLELKDSSGAVLATGGCQPGQLSFSNCDTYEFVTCVESTRALSVDDICEVSVVYQNSYGCSFRYCEKFKLSWLPGGRTVSSTEMRTLQADMVFTGKAVTKILEEKGHHGVGFVKTNDQIKDGPIVSSEAEKEIARLKDLRRDKNRSYCQAVIDGDKLRKDLTSYHSEM